MSDNHEAVAASTNDADPAAIDKAEENYIDISRILNETTTKYEIYNDSLAVAGFSPFAHDTAPCYDGGRGSITFKPH